MDNKGEAKFKILPEKEFASLLNEVVTIRAEVSVLTEIILSQYAATSKTSFKDLVAKFQSTLLEKRDLILATLYANYGHEDLNDLTNE